MNPQVLRRAPRVLGAAALFSTMLIAPAASAMVDAPTSVTGQACEGDAGVTVVVDFSDTGGDIVIACAEGSQESGRAALEAAGFTPEDSMPGMICAIDSSPDPCPEEFDGNFWSYWFGNDDGDWEMYMVGADDAEPAPGSVEGWRYFDGSEAPQVNPGEIVGGVSVDVETPEADGDVTGEQGEAGDVEAPEATDDGEDAPTDEAPGADAAPEADAESSSSTAMWIAVVAALIAALVAVYAGVTAQKRKQQ